MEDGLLNAMIQERRDHAARRAACARDTCDMCGRETRFDANRYLVPSALGYFSACSTKCANQINNYIHVSRGPVPRLVGLATVAAVLKGQK